MLESTVLVDPRAILLCRIALGSVMSLAGVGKMSTGHKFEQLLHEGFGFRERFARLTALWLPPIELVLGVMLLLGLVQVAAAGMIVSMLLMFSLWLLRMRLLGYKEMRCGCFGDADTKKPTSPMILRNILLMLPGLLVCAYPSEYLALGGGPARPANGVPAIDALAVVLSAVGVLLLTGLVQVPGRLRKMSAQLARLPEGH